MVANPIVSAVVQVVTAPTPNKLQQMGAFISAGATTLSDGDYALLTQFSDLTPLLSPPLVITSLTWSGGTVIVNTAAAIPGRTAGESFRTQIAGTSPAGFSGLVLATVTGTNSFTYPLAVNPGAEVTPGTYSPPSQGEIIAMATTFFAQGSSQAVYVLEFGPGDGSTGPSALNAWIQTNPNFFYIYLTPISWDATSGFLALIANYASPTSLTYFVGTTTVGNYPQYPPSKNLLLEVTAPGTPLTEFSAAAMFHGMLSKNPSSINRMTPLAYEYLFGVTPYPQQGNNSLLTQLVRANVNYVGTGAQAGQASQYILFTGTVMSGVDFAFWFSGDWAQLNCTQNVANAIVVGNNTSANPLYYNQQGINTLQDTLVATLNQGITYGLLNGTVTLTGLDQVTFGQNLDNGVYAGQNVINAIPFLPYTQANPSDYQSGIYQGFTVVVIPQLPFKTIVFSLLITDLLSL